MSTTISSSSAAQETYRSQLSGSRTDRSLNSLTSSLKSAEKMAAAIGADTSALKSAQQQVSGTTSTATGSSTKVTLSSEGVARQQAESSRSERRQFASVDEAIAYGTQRATEQQGSRATNTTNTTNTSNTTDTTQQTAATNGSTRRQFSSVDDAIAYGTARAAEQSGRSSQTTNQSEATTGNGRRQFASTDEAIAYGTQRALEQYNKQQLALGSASN